MTLDEKTAINPHCFTAGYFERIRLHPVMSDKKSHKGIITPAPIKEEEPRKVSPERYARARGEAATFYQLIEKYCVATAMWQSGERSREKIGKRFKINLEEIITQEREEIAEKIARLGEEATAAEYGVPYSFLKEVYSL
jgi:hypothetical protein